MVVVVGCVVVVVDVVVAKVVVVAFKKRNENVTSWNPTTSWSELLEW